MASDPVIRLLRFDRRSASLFVIVGKSERVREINLNDAQQAELLRDLAIHRFEREVMRDGE